MRAAQYRRDRPTMQTAHAFIHQGHETDPKKHYFDGDERAKEIIKIGDDLQELFRAQFPRTQNLEYAILKAHLIVEHALVQYIRCSAATYVQTKDIRFTFSQKLEFAYLLGFGANDPTLLPTVERLNKVRNQVAHSFELDRAALDEMLRIYSEDYDTFKPKDDRERIRILRWICGFVCGAVSGLTQAAYTMAKLDEDRLRAAMQTRAKVAKSAPEG